MGGRGLGGIKLCVELGQVVHFSYEAEQLATRGKVHQKVQVLLRLHSDSAPHAAMLHSDGRE
jgi:hypothetical protein